jgi:hypothetical protein
MNINDDNIEVIDLSTPVNDVAATIVTTNNLAQLSLATTTTTAVVAAAATAAAFTSIKEQTSYKSRTLTPNSRRRLILPAFPASMENDHCPNLLLANVPGK